VPSRHQHTTPNMIVSSIENLSSHVAATEDIQAVSNYQNPRPLGITKEQFRSWCAANTTHSKFISVWQGINPKARISTGNPATRLHGIIGDYDSATAYANIGELPRSCGVLPTWVIQTFTPGKVRLIWEFESPVNVGNVELTERFIQQLDKRIRFSKALPGWDKSSTDSNQYFEVGSNWQRIIEATPVPESLLEMAMMEAATSAKITSNDVEIPMEAIAQEVARQFPGRWQKPFDIGQRGPLFWIADGIDREGCVVTQNGMVCFSDRAASNFMPWRSILGSKFVQEYEQEVIGGAASKFYTDGKAYYTKPNGEWIGLSREDAKLQLKVMGVSDQKRKGQNASDVDAVLAHIQIQRRVVAAVPVLYRDSDIELIGGERYLNLNTRQAMQPAQDGDPALWPWIHAFVENAFDGGRDHFLGWFKHFYESALHNDLQPGQVIVIAGDAHTGKSFINRWMIGAALGGSVNATQVLMRQSSFNKQAGEVGLWRVDDAPTDGDPRDKRRFTQALKEHAANPTLLYHPKFRDAIELPFLGRVVITMNIDPESLALLPAMDSSFADKVMLFRLRDGFVPKFKRTTTENESQMLAELPHFLRWILNWEIPREIVNKSKPRYGVKPFHHPKLVEESHAESVEYSVQELLEPWCVGKSKDKDAQTCYTATELLHELQNDMPGLTRHLTAQKLAKSLSKLLGSWPILTEKYISRGIAKYRFNFEKEISGGGAMDEPF
jgi:hypothetical protein